VTVTLFIHTYLCQLFFCHDVGKALRNVCYCDVTFSARQWYDNTDIFLNQVIQFYSNNAINLQQLTLHSTPCCPTT